MPQRSPLIRSGVILRAIATAATLTSLASMTAFAATHVQNDAAPLKPAATTTIASATAAPAPTSRTTTTRTTTVTGRVTTTTTTARTKTHSS